MFDCSEERKISAYKPQRARLLTIRRWYVCGAVLACSLIILLSGCSLFATPSQSGTASPGVTPEATKVITPTPNYKPPTITLTVSNCPTLSFSWDSLIGAKAGVDKVQTVTCGSLEGPGSLTALVGARYYTPDAKLDIYVYDNLNGNPTKRFSVQGLLNGDVKVSPSNTIMTAEATPGNSTPTLPNLFKEYQWNGTSFTQVLFPGIFPDMTSYQAHQSQAMVNANMPNEGWRTSGFGVLDMLTRRVFHWPQTRDQVVTFSTKNNVYIVESFNLGAGGGGVVATLFHLDNRPNTIFEIKQLTSIDGGLTVNTPAAGTQLTSPISASANYTANSGILVRVVLYDNIFFAFEDTGAIHGSASSGAVTFTQLVPYQLDSKGLREGVVAFYATNQNNISLSNDVVLVKVFFSA